MQDFDIYFSGKLLPDTAPEAARAAIGQLFRLEGKALERLFSGHPVRIKQGVDAEHAGRYRATFRKAGALVDIVPGGAAPPSQQAAERSSEAPTEGGETLQLLPARSGSLEDCAPRVEPLPLPDIGWMQAEPPGSTLDETPPPEPRLIDTGGLNMSEAAAFTLEDCVTRPQPAPLPDISHLQLVDEGENDDAKTG